MNIALKNSNEHPRLILYFYGNVCHKLNDELNEEMQKFLSRKNRIFMQT